MSNTDRPAINSSNLSFFKIMRHNCNLFRALKMGYVRSMLRWCNANGWKYFWADTFVNWWRINHMKTPTHTAPPVESSPNP
jgi:hypothetical protein